MAVAHGAGSGNGSGGHGAASHHGGLGHSHRGGWHKEHGAIRGRYRGGDSAAWSIPGRGVYFASIPSYCRLVYWNGAAYYYADDLYYEWSATAGAYEQVQPPAGLAESISGQEPVSRDLFVFPNADQTIEQLERDRDECQRWAAEQVGLDLTVAANHANYLRADAACLESRDYSVE